MKIPSKNILKTISITAILCLAITLPLGRSSISSLTLIASAGTINYNTETTIPTPTPTSTPSTTPTPTSTPSTTPTPTSTPSTTPTPTSTPSTTPTPTIQPNGNNLALINDGQWWTDNTWQKCPAANVYYDTSITHNGAPTWRVQSGNNWGPDHAAITVHGGDHVVMSCWIKTAGSPSGTYTNIGARIGLDYYTGNWQQRIMGAGSPTDASTGVGWPNVARQENTAPSVIVDYGSDCGL